MPRRSSSPSFVDRHGLWTDEQSRLASAVVQQIKQRKLELVRFSFADQHGVLRGKTLLAGEAASAMKSGVNMTTTLLAKDTSHKTVFPVFTAGGGLNMPEMQGGADFVMVPDPATFRVLPWAPNTGWLLCDIYFANGKPVPFSSRRLYREALSRLATAGFDFLAGLEVEFHLFAITNPRLTAEDATWPPAVPYVALLGPRGRRERLCRELGGAGLALAPRLHGPAGLDIGADSPEAIALSILAELFAVRSGRAGGSLDQRA